MNEKKRKKEGTHDVDLSLEMETLRQCTIINLWLN